MTRARSCNYTDQLYDFEQLLRVEVFLGMQLLTVVPLTVGGGVHVLQHVLHPLLPLGGVLEHYTATARRRGEDGWFRSAPLAAADYP